MPRLLISCFAALLLTVLAPRAHANAADDQFAKQFGDAWLEQYFALQPDAGIYNGNYRYAAQLPAPTPAYRSQLQAFAAKGLRQLQAMPPAALSPSVRADWQLLRNQLQSLRWTLAGKRDWQWNPALYNVAEPLALLLHSDYAPESERLRTVLARLREVPAYYAAAQRSLHHPTLEHTALAIKQNAGALEVMGKDLAQQVAASPLSAEEKQQFEAARLAAVAAAQGYIDALKGLHNPHPRSFRLGQPLYEQQFGYDIAAGISAKGLYQKAQLAKAALHARMSTAADALWPKYMGTTPPPAEPLKKIAALIAVLSKQHVSREGFVDEVKRQIPLLEAWVRDKDLLTLDASRPLQVRETPPYLQGTSIASINAPGPYDPTAKTFYNVSPLADYTPEQAESFLQEYNSYILQVLNIHEAVPGHYVQLIYANKSPSKIKAIFGNGAMVEGWAVYSERMMLESGWANNSDEMWLMYAKWNLRVVCNTLLDYGVHVLGMSEQEALALLTEQAFQSQTEAQGKWRRVQLSHVQLTSYFAGFSAIMDLREAVKAAEGERFSLKRFHEQFLSYGSAPVGVIRGLMMDREQKH